MDLNVCVSGWRDASRFVLGVAAALAALVGADAQTLPPDFSNAVVATGLSNPTCMAVAPDGSVYIAQQAGALRVWKSSTNTLSTVTTFAVNSQGERGLIGVALDPAFSDNKFVYVHYTVGAVPIHNTVRRITLDHTGTAMVPDSEALLLELDALGSSFHNGGAMHIGTDGRLYIGVGENLSSANAQNIANLKGKILRINTDPQNVIPSDNPTSFPGITGTPTGNNRAIWAVGLRNPFTFAIQPGTGRMFINDVGASTWEEINDGMRGKNYGWPMTEGGFDQGTYPNFTHPLVAYRHNDGTTNYPPSVGTFTGIVISGGTFYNPAAPNFPRAYEGAYFFADYISDYIRTFDPATSTGAGFISELTAPVDLRIAPDGTLLYLSRLSTQGLRRITYTGTSGVCCSASGTCTLSNGIGCDGVFLWGTLSCSPDPCAIGACCIDVMCIVTTPAACMGTGRRYVGNDSACNASGNTSSPCCRADYDQSGSLTIDDLFLYLNAYFASQPAADFNGIGGVTIDDLFLYLNAYFTGC